ncbi:MAG: hypothetical protein JJU24_05220 [Natronohydrobacter sp.]|nr:hypothetical protein [Natronohydrobacter sp.]
MSGPLDIARSAWGTPVPDWIETLARACAARSQVSVANDIGRSPALVSQVLRRKYPGDLGAVEQAVRGAFMGAQVTCPAKGAIATHECQGWQRKARQFVNSNPQRVRMFRACNNCPRNARALHLSTKEGETT